MKYKKIGEVRAHRVIAEKALDRALKDKELVHHWDENGENNENTNLVICPNDAYHRLLHTRMDAYNKTGNPNFRKCYLCKVWCDPKAMTQVIRRSTSTRPNSGNYFYHKTCAVNNYKRSREQILIHKQERRFFGSEN